MGSHSGDVETGKFQRELENWKEVMTRKSLNVCLLLAFASALALIVVNVLGAPPKEPSPAKVMEQYLPETEIEARTRARMLHETIHGALQVMHRDFFDPDQRLSIPSRSLEDVFKELGQSWQVSVHWLVVNAEAMNVDNEPRDDFEREAAKQLASGKPEYAVKDGNVYRFAGAIRLASQCLKCHAPRRTSTEDRVAGLVISMPLRGSR